MKPTLLTKGKVPVRHRIPTEFPNSDALHLAIATQIGAGSIATAGRTMAVAAKQLGLDCVRFD